MNHQILPEHIRASLAKYNKYQQCTCLACGYSGQMGVHREENKVGNTKGWIIILSILGILALISIQQQMAGKPIIPFWFMGLVGIGLGIYSSRKNIYVICPNCNSELEIK
jgi:hypothetical protein